MIAFNEQVRHAAEVTQQPVVTRKDRPAFGPRVPQQGQSGEMRTVCGILADQPEPGGEAAEHPIDREAMDSHGSAASSIAVGR